MQGTWQSHTKIRSLKKNSKRGGDPKKTCHSQKRPCRYEWIKRVRSWDIPSQPRACARSFAHEAEHLSMEARGAECTTHKNTRETHAHAHAHAHEMRNTDINDSMHDRKWPVHTPDTSSAERSMRGGEAKGGVSFMGFVGVEADGPAMEIVRLKNT